MRLFFWRGATLLFYCFARHFFFCAHFGDFFIWRDFFLCGATFFWSNFFLVRLFFPVRLFFFWRSFINRYQINCGLENVWLSKNPRWLLEISIYLGCIRLSLFRPFRNKNPLLIRRTIKHLVKCNDWGERHNSVVFFF